MMVAAQPPARNDEIPGRQPGQDAENQADVPGGEPLAPTPADAFARPDPPVPFENADFRPPAQDVADAAPRPACWTTPGKSRSPARSPSGCGSSLTTARSSSCGRSTCRWPAAPGSP